MNHLKIILPLMLLVLFQWKAFAEIITEETTIAVNTLGKNSSYRVVAYFEKEQLNSKKPAIIVFHGSTGEIPKDKAIDYAKKGYIGVAVHYFDYFPSDRPLTNTRLPLEGFEKMLTWVNSRTYVSEKKIVLDGRSSGAELVLLLSRFYGNMISGVIAEVPNSYVWGDRRNGVWSRNIPFEQQLVDEFVEMSSWTMKGKDIPFIKMNALLQEKSIEKQHEDGFPIFKYRPAFEQAIQAATPKELEQARHKVEEIPVPVLFTGAKLDDMWPSSSAIALFKEKRKHLAIAKNDIYLNLEAGHMWFKADTYLKYPSGYYDRIVSTKTCSNLHNTPFQYEIYQKMVLEICQDPSRQEDLNSENGIYFGAPEWAKTGTHKEEQNEIAQKLFEREKNKFLQNLF